MLNIIQTGIQGLIEIQPKCFEDERGWFLESYKKSAYEEIGLTADFNQDNISFSKKGVLRGLHFQKFPHAQAKLVWVLQGSVYDVAVDLRPNSVTFGKAFGLILNSSKKNMLFIPEGFAHGFMALEDALFQYKCSTEYHPGSEAGIIWNDSSIGIEWPEKNPLVSSKDMILPTLNDLITSGVLIR